MGTRFLFLLLGQNSIFHGGLASAWILSPEHAWSGTREDRTHHFLEPGSREELPILQPSFSFYDKDTFHHF